MARSNGFMEITSIREGIWRGLACALLLAVCGCYSPNPPAGSPCADDSRCPRGQLCIAGFCGGSQQGVDGMTTDVSTTDAPADGAIGDGPPGGCTLPSECPNTNPCVTMTCVNTACVATPRASGSSCGPTEANRCCGTTCVNISTDGHNCGGCGETCAVGRACESVSSTTTCGIKPAATAGRCTCAGATAECPDNQICRTVSPYANRCTPETSAECAAGATYVEVNFCPNFCRYP